MSFGGKTALVTGGAGFVGVNFAINTFLTERIEETISGYAASTVINIYGNDLDALEKFVASWCGHAMWADSNNLLNWIEDSYGLTFNR